MVWIVLLGAGCSPGLAERQDRPAAATTQAVAPCTVTAALDKSVYRGGEPVFLRVEVTNRSETGTLVLQHKNQIYPKLTITCDGKAIPMTLYGQQRIRSMVSDVHGAILMGRQSHTFRLLLSRYFDMTLPGEYRVTMQCEVRDAARRSEPLILIPSEIVVRIEGRLPYPDEPRSETGGR